jgi:RNA polymerase sigma factor (sigma-70 family)
MATGRYDPLDVADVERMDDDELVRRVVDLRDEAAAGELAMRSYPYIMTRVQRFEHPLAPGVRIPQDDRGDAAQDAWLRTRQALLNLRDPGAFRGVLRTAVHNTCLDWCRRDLRHDKQRGGSIDDTREGADGGTYGAMDAQLGRIAGRAGDVADDVGRADELERALARLPDKQREVVRLTDMGYVSKEIAEAMGESVANVDQMRSRAYRQLRRELE